MSAKQLKEALDDKLVFSSAELKSRRKEPASPFIVARVDEKLVPDHNGIWGEAFTGFLGEFMQLFAQDERDPARRTK